MKSNGVVWFLRILRVLRLNNTIIIIKRNKNSTEFIIFIVYASNAFSHPRFCHDGTRQTTPSRIFQPRNPTRRKIPRIHTFRNRLMTINLKVLPILPTESLLHLHAPPPLLQPLVRVRRPYPPPTANDFNTPRNLACVRIEKAEAGGRNLVKVSTTRRGCVCVLTVCLLI